MLRRFPHAFAGQDQDILQRQPEAVPHQAFLPLAFIRRIDGDILPFLFPGHPIQHLRRHPLRPLGRALAYHGVFDGVWVLLAFVRAFQIAFQ